MGILTLQLGVCFLLSPPNTLRLTPRERLEKLLRRKDEPGSLMRVARKLSTRWGILRLTCMSGKGIILEHD